MTLPARGAPKASPSRSRAKPPAPLAAAEAAHADPVALPAAQAPAPEDAPVREEAQAQAPGREERIRVAAYGRYLARGMASGHEVEDWLDAEREVDGQPPRG
ncbi:DUF2934 domain-containing protein [Aquincola sp. MAHUQ-54]|uniref:DUF2934 domain-containing protein n=1 Tax=Aquincola agrisoli TaxID=3119538 RepID=A0AAW9Q879_9BURK